jgi:hypothetical protein
MSRRVRRVPWRGHPMSAPVLMSVSGQISLLQANIAAASAGMSEMTHHPIACVQGNLSFHEDGSLECEHKKAPPEDRRTRACVGHSIAILLIEEMARREANGQAAVL